MNYVYFGFRLVNKQWGNAFFTENSTAQDVSLPITVSDALTLSTFAYGSIVHSIFGGWHTTTQLKLYRHIISEDRNVYCRWFGLFK